MLKIYDYFFKLSCNYVLFKNEEDGLIIQVKEFKKHLKEYVNLSKNILNLEIVTAVFYIIYFICQFPSHVFFTTTLFLMLVSFLFSLIVLIEKRSKVSGQLFDIIIANELTIEKR